MSEPLEIGYVLVPVDFSPASAEALRYARALAARCGARVELVHVVDARVIDGLLGHAAPAVWQEALAAARTKLEALAGEDPWRVLEGRPADVIADHASAVQADLIVTGCVGRTGLERLLLGSVADALLRAAPCPVLVVRPPRPVGPAR